MKLLLILTVLAISNSNRDGVTRVTCALEGTPHTSDRIDSAVLHHAGKTYKATDIDGIDFKRYFQWEDDGIIEVDIDFPHCNNLSVNDSVTITTIRGDVTTRLNSAANHVK